LENSPQYKIKAPYLDYVFSTGELAHVGFSEVRKKEAVNLFSSKIQIDRVISISVSLQNYVSPMLFCVFTIALKPN